MVRLRKKGELYQVWGSLGKGFFFLWVVGSDDLMMIDDSDGIQKLSGMEF